MTRFPFIDREKAHHDVAALCRLLPSAANLLWLTDITEPSTAEGKLYLCAVKDVTPVGSSATRSTRG